ncbi:MAG: hypothetical protein LBT04_06540 [Prevotellaceae bacterium]|nr:hypothetical protein [Prevotellaceae bacterium]
MHETPDDVSLFHEILHWFHMLRYHYRFIWEGAPNNDTKIYNTGKSGLILIGEEYYKDISGTENDEKRKVSSYAWCAKGSNSIYFVNFEELRTILGGNTESDKYENGDELSENLYRLCRNEPLRFGHSSCPYYESNVVIQRAIDSLNRIKDFFNIADIKLLGIIGENDVKPPFQTTDAGSIDEGLGGCKILKPIVSLIR